MDGVLIDSTPAVERVWRQWAIERGFPPEEVVRKSRGRPSITTLRDYLPNADHAAENEGIVRREMADLDGIVPLPGAADLLRSLPRDRWAIVTSSTRPLADLRLRVAGLPRPACVLTADDIRCGKPAPEPYEEASARLGFAAQDCVVVEDVPAGVVSGKAAGARVAGLLTTTDEAALREAGADWVVENCAAISLVDSEPQRGELLLTLQGIRSPISSGTA